ncbi:UDP-glycosyltransferase UGT5-like isoform X3 [Palaemon carinicauda]|uniref:UDP-glycosyltransferase UGT5-like isoform X3 n=1 Tax=Palaemon carinicauda TaxID=392227 RepID=UPI0035B6689F
MPDPFWLSRKMKWWALVAVLLLIPDDQYVDGSRILFISAIASKSHKGFFTAVIDKLAKEGHQITIVSPYKPTKEKENVHEIVLSNVDITSLAQNVFEGDTMSGAKAIMTIAPKMCSDALGRKEVQELLNEKYDIGMLSIFLSDCFLSLFHRMEIPVIQISPTGPIGPIGALAGLPTFPSFVTNAFLQSFHPLTFTDRMLNALTDTVSTAAVEHVILPNMDTECRLQGLCPANMPSLNELKKNATVMFVNSVRYMESPPRPSMASIVYVGGIHCHEAKALPEDLEKWVAGAGEDGFIFFSLGSVVKPSTMPEEYRKVLVKVFGSLKQRVLWKWDTDTMEDLPRNVRLEKWLPQQDILGDPRLKVFITHGGALSTQESIYHSTPVIGLPVLADQMTNMAEVQNQGWGRMLKWRELTFEVLRDTIHTVITDEKLRAEVKRRSSLMRDTPQDLGQLVNYWVDYVIKHNGAHHLKSPFLTMPWYEIYNVDVWLTIAGVLLLLLLLVLKLFLMCLRCLTSRFKEKHD